jgi:hypothetical protein
MSKRSSDLGVQARRTLTLVAATLAAATTSALAIPVTYQTSASFNGNPFAQNNSLTIGGITLNYTGLPSTTVDANPLTFIQLGDFEAVGEGTGNFNNQDFDLRITQSAPTGGTGDLDADLSGTISSGPPGSSTLLVTFTQPSVTIGSALYLLDDITIQVPPPGRSVTISGSVIIPEPTTVGSIVCLSGLILFRRQR